MNIGWLTAISVLMVMDLIIQNLFLRRVLRKLELEQPELIERRKSPYYVRGTFLDVRVIENLLSGRFRSDVISRETRTQLARLMIVYRIICLAYVSLLTAGVILSR